MNTPVRSTLTFLLAGCALALSAPLVQGCAPPQDVRAPAPGDDGRGPGGPGGPRGRPPEEALAACSGRAAGDACSFKSPEGTDFKGLCDTPPDGTALACRPEGGPGGPGGPGGHGAPPHGGPGGPPPGGPGGPPPGGPGGPPPGG